MRVLKFLFIALFVMGCAANPDGDNADTETDIVTGTDATQQSTDTSADISDSSCGHRVNNAIVKFGFNIVVDTAGKTQSAQGRPLQEGWILAESPTEISDHNNREYARIAAYMMPIRDALICDIATLDKADWLSLTKILTLNNIKLEQNLSGKPPERVYSVEGIYELLRAGETFHPMMKFLEEAELELKCMAFQEFDFTNPKGDDHCAIHGLPVGQGLTLP